MKYTYSFCFCKKDLLIDVKLTNTKTRCLEDAIEEAKSLPVSLIVFPNAMKLKADTYKDVTYPILLPVNGTPSLYTLKKMKDASRNRIEELYSPEYIWQMIDAGKLESLITTAPYLADSTDYEEAAWSAEELYHYLNNDFIPANNHLGEMGFEFKCYSYKVTESDLSV